jgi:hypothetical protein
VINNPYIKFSVFVNSNSLGGLEKTALKKLKHNFTKDNIENISKNPKTIPP